MPEISMCTLVVWVNHSSEECLNKPQLYAVGERIAEITLNVNTTGYSRRKDDLPDGRDAGANVLELAAGSDCTQNQSLVQESGVCADAVELMRLRINL
jgi:hypothetical protein